MQKIKAISFALASFCFALSAQASDSVKGGFSLGSTRVIYKEEQKETTVTVINSAKNSPFLAQSWISSYESELETNKPPFVITPPLYRQDQGKNTLRIIRNGGTLPDDRESAFWLNVKAIPAQAKESKNNNSISFAYVIKVKLFYRPVGLASSPSEAYKELSFSKNGNTLTAHNPTPYYITINKLYLNGIEVKDVSAMVSPMSKQSYSLPVGTSGKKITYRTLNDMGGVMPEQNKDLVN